MDILVELDQPTDTLMEIGRFEDLEILVELLNGAFESVEYRMEKVSHERGMYLFIEDPKGKDEYLCGAVKKKGKMAYAISPMVHALIMDAYEAYLDETGNA
jgi:hypothetical protein